MDAELVRLPTTAAAAESLQAEHSIPAPRLLGKSRGSCCTQVRVIQSRCTPASGRGDSRTVEAFFDREAQALIDSGADFEH